MLDVYAQLDSDIELDTEHSDDFDEENFAVEEAPTEVELMVMLSGIVLDDGQVLLKRRTSDRIKQRRFALDAPRLFVRRGDRLEIGGRCARIIDPLTQHSAAVDEIDG
jgi:hypothetical protein